MSPIEHWYSTQHIALTALNNLLLCVFSQVDNKLCKECSLLLLPQQKRDIESLLLGLYTFVCATYAYDDFEIEPYSQVFTRKAFCYWAELVIDTHKKKILPHIVPSLNINLRELNNIEALELFKPYVNLLNLLNDFNENATLIENNTCEGLEDEDEDEDDI